ncbi:hypothetical protein PAMC26577_38850 [Caballeronia sordidicola]|uniref:Uncharacterized protein n=1 Tax=Caballeronia sordidicola TaxID=196367 RepID=A0A242M3D1_CABSO|nr:hypothetical protein PAMC26577_38850 [Caballeronia sordidicola]
MRRLSYRASQIYRLLAAPASAGATENESFAAGAPLIVTLSPPTEIG